jgi:hypothetical protein
VRHDGDGELLRHGAREVSRWVAEREGDRSPAWQGQRRRSGSDSWARALGSIDVKEREGHLVEAATIMVEDAMVVLTHWTPDVVAYNGDLLGPRENAVTYTSRIWNIWEWRWR